MKWHEIHGGRPITTRMLMDAVEPVSAAERAKMAKLFIQTVSLPALRWYGRRVPSVARACDEFAKSPPAMFLFEAWRSIANSGENYRATLYQRHADDVSTLLRPWPVAWRTPSSAIIDFVAAAKSTPKPLRQASIEKVIQMCYGLAARRIAPGWSPLPSPEEVMVIQDMLAARAA